ncbi:MAG: CPBP family intramembrane metalloprotease [Bacteroidetes bacterium]|nr:CPBP family intramembrane metalloprotease [Bacteroidota bacterium]MBU1718057.1 CPBP family intramembrane metalloprotease [Bacteroidota bacterium]
MLFTKVKAYIFQAGESAQQPVTNTGRFRNPGSKALVVAITAALCLVMIEYLAKSPGFPLFADFLRFLGFGKAADQFYHWAAYGNDAHFKGLIYWALCSFFFYAVVPLIVIKLVLRQRIRDFGLFRGNLRSEFRVFLLMLAIMLPIVWFISDSASFQSRYPFYQPANDESLATTFVWWEMLYLLQFVGLEFFFRGFMVHGTREAIGANAVLFMMVPYCMIHFGKPLPEAIAAIIAGLALGYVSLKSRSIWIGVMLHYCVAITMDFSALFREGYFG